MTRAKAIRKRYVWWCADGAYKARECPSTTHHLYRLGKIQDGKTVKDRAKAIRECVGSPSEVSKCRIPNCLLYPFRFGYSKWEAIRASGEKTQVQAGSCMAEKRKVLKVPYIGYFEEEGMT